MDALRSLGITSQIQGVTQAAMQLSHETLPHKYLISGLYVQSDHPVHFLDAGWNSDVLSAQVTIRTLDLTHSSLPKQSVSRRTFAFQPKPGLILKVFDGSHITIYRDGRITDQDVNLFLLGSAWGVLCYQRGLLPLHCSSVATCSDAFAFVAQSGGGKSTLAASLCGLGFLHVCDDVAIAETPGTNGATVRAMPKGLKLWREATEVLGFEPRALVTSDTHIEKYYVDPPEGPLDPILNLKAIYTLEFVEDHQEPEIVLLTGSAPLKEVYRNAYRVEWLGEIGGADWVLSQARTIADRVPVFRFSRPKALGALKECSAVLAQHMEALTAKTDDSDTQQCKVR